MAGIINGFNVLIDSIKMLFGFIGSMLEGIVLVFRYLMTIATLAVDALVFIPSWLQAFCIITISISIGYFLIGRNTGKSD